MAADSAQDLEDALVASAQARGKQSNLTFFAFTATPKAKTLEIFGQKVRGLDGEERYVPFHLCTRCAKPSGRVSSSMCCPTTRPTAPTIGWPTVWAGTIRAAEAKAASALARYVSLHPTNLAQKAEIIVNHFPHPHRVQDRWAGRRWWETRSRLHAVRYHQAITSYISEKGYDTGTDRSGSWWRSPGPCSTRTCRTWSIGRRCSTVREAAPAGTVSPPTSTRC